MMQTVQPWHCNNSATHTELAPCFTSGRRFFRQREMRPVLVVVTDVLVHQAFQMPFIENDHMVKQIAAAVTNSALGYTVLPRTSEAGSFGLDAECLHCLDYFMIE